MRGNDRCFPVFMSSEELTDMDTWGGKKNTWNFAGLGERDVSCFISDPPLLVFYFQ